MATAVNRNQETLLQRALPDPGGRRDSLYTSGGYSVFFFEQGVVYAQLNDRRKFHIDYTLEQLEDVLDPGAFFRVSRKFIVRLEAIERIFTYFNGRLKLSVNPSPPTDVIVSRDRVPDFKAWMDR